MLNHFFRLSKVAIFITIMCIVIFVTLTYVTMYVASEVTYKIFHSEISNWVQLSNNISKYIVLASIAAGVLSYLWLIYAAYVRVWETSGKAKRLMSDEFGCRTTIGSAIDAGIDKVFLFTYNKTVPEMKIFFGDEILYLMLLSINELMFMFTDSRHKRKFAVVLRIDKLKKLFNYKSVDNFEYAIWFDQLNDAVCRTQSYDSQFYVINYDYEFDNTDYELVYNDYFARLKMEER